MKLTEAGRALRVRAESILQAASDFEHEARTMQTELKGKVVIGLNHTPVFLRVPALIGIMAERHPGLELTCVNSASNKIMDGLRDGTLDGGYIFGDLPADDLVSCKVTTANLVVMAPEKWRCHIEARNWEELAKLPWLHADGYCPFQNLQDQLFAKQGLQYRRSVQAEDEYMRAELVGNGIALALMEKTEAERTATNGGYVIWEPEELRCDLFFASLRRRTSEPHVRVLQQIIAEIWGLD
jgi:DNA-binding transcriptional LysR family regulator